MFVSQFFAMVGKIENYTSLQQFMSTIKRVESIVRRFSTQIFHLEPGQFQLCHLTIEYQ